MQNEIIEIINQVGAKWWAFSGTMLVQASILICILLVVDLIIRTRVRAVVRYWIWMLVLAKLAMPTGFAMPTGVGYWCGDLLSKKTAEAPIAAAPVQPEVQTVQMPALQNALTQPRPQALPGAAILPQSPQQIRQAEPAKAVIAGPQITWQGLAFLGWIAGMAVIGVLIVQRIRFAMSLIAQSKPATGRVAEVLEECRVQMGVKNHVQLRLTSNMLSPAACGLARPVILMPDELLANLSRQKVRAILVHELAHIKRGDLWVNMAQTILQAVYFYNPLVWLANAAIRQVREQAVDETAMVSLGDEAGQYGATLVDVAQMALTRPHLSLRLVGVVESKKTLTARIKHIVSRPIPKTAKIGVSGALAVMLIGAVLLPMAKAKTLATEDTGSTESKTKFVKTLDNGVTVELVGVCDYPSKGKQWWQPDGSREIEPISIGNEAKQKLQPGQIARTMAIAVGPNVSDVDLYSKVAGSDRRAQWPVGITAESKGRYIFAMNFQIGKGTETAVVKAGIAASEWKNLVSIRAQGGGSTFYDADAKSVNFDSTYEENGMVCLPVAWKSEPNLFAYRIIAVDTSGKIHQAVETGKFLYNQLASGTWKFSMSTQDVNQFIIQRRPYEWVEFKDVKLKPAKNLTTEPAESTEKISYNSKASESNTEITNGDPNRDALMQKSAAMLKALYSKLIIYANDHNNLYPEDLSQIANLDVPESDLTWYKGNIEYLGADKKVTDPPSTILAYDRVFLEKYGKTPVLYSDSSIGAVLADAIPGIPAEVKTRLKQNAQISKRPIYNVKMLGMKLADLTPELRQKYNIPSVYKGGIVILDAGGEPERLGIGNPSSGDMFFMVGNKRVNNICEMAQELLRINAIPRPAKAHFVDEGWHGLIRVVYAVKTSTNTQYLKLSDYDVRQLQQIVSVFCGSNSPDPNSQPIAPITVRDNNDNMTSDAQLSSQLVSNHYELLDVNLCPVQQGKNILYVTARNKTDRPQHLGIHIYTRSPDYMPNGMGWGSSFGNEFLPHETQTLRFVYQIQGPITGATYVQVKIYDSNERAPSAKPFFVKKHSSDLLHKDESLAHWTSVPLETGEMLRTAFLDFKNAIKDENYELAWSYFTEDFKKAELQGDYSRLVERMTTPGLSRWFFDRHDIVGLVPGYAGQADGKFIFWATDSNHQEWRFIFINQNGRLKIDWIYYTPALVHIAFADEFSFRTSADYLTLLYKMLLNQFPNHNFPESLDKVSMSSSEHQWFTENITYLGRNSQLKISDNVLAYDKKILEQFDETNVLYADGSIKKLSSDQLPKSPDHNSQPATHSKEWPRAKLLVLDNQTREPVANCSFVLGHWGTWKQTNETGIFDKDEDNFHARLSSCEELELWHPDYESKFFERHEDGRPPYTPGLTGTVTVLLEKSGHSAVDVNVALIVRGKKKDNESCSIRIFRGQKAGGFEVRKSKYPAYNRCQFSGLAAGNYVAEVYFNDSHPTHYESFQLAADEQKTLQINVITDELAAIPLKGRILDKFTGKGIAGAFLGSIPSETGKSDSDGLFSTVGERSHFHESVIYLDYAHQYYILARMNNHMSEELAQRLEFHIDPNDARDRHSFLEDKDGDGIFCERSKCLICANVETKPDPNSQPAVKKPAQSSCTPPNFDPNGGPMIGGYVRTREGLPISGVDVRVSWPVKRAMQMVDGRDITTDSNGYWTCRLSNEANDISVRLAHTKYLPMAFDYRPAYKDLVAKKAVLVMKSGVKVTGIVQDANGSPIANVLVMPRHSIMSVSAATGIKDSPKTTRSDAQGNFTLSSVDSGMQTIAFDARGYAPDFVDVNVSPAMPALKIVLDHGTVVQGQVVDINGSPIENVTIKCDMWEFKDESQKKTFRNVYYKQLKMLRRETMTGSNGRFTLVNMPDKGMPFIFLGKKPNYYPADLTPDLAKLEPNMVILFPIQPITGTVIDDQTGSAITDFEIASGFKWNLEDKGKWDLTSDSVSSQQGKFSQIPGGFMTYSKPAWVATRITAKGYQTAQTPWLGIHEKFTPVTVRLKKAKTLDLAISTPFGKAAAEAQLYLIEPGLQARVESGRLNFNATNSPSITLAADENGHINFTLPQSQSTVLILSDAGYYIGDSNSIPKQILLTQWSNVTGKIDVDSSTASSYVLIGTTDYKAPVVWSVRQTTGPDGAFNIDRIPAIKQKVWFGLTGQNGHVQGISPLPGETITLNFPLGANTHAAGQNRKSITPGDMTMEQLAQICEKMESSLKTIHLKYESYANPAPEINDIAGTGFLIAKGHSRYELLTARPFKDHVRLSEWVTLANSSGNSWDSFTQSSFNGTTSKHLSTGGFPTANKYGEISKGKIYVPESMNITPLGFSVLQTGFADGSDTQTLSAVLREFKNSLVLDKSISRINGFDCIKVELISRFRNKPIRRIYFSTAHGYTPVRFEYVNGSDVTSLSVTSLQQVSSDLWFPIAGITESPHNKISSIYRTTEPAIINKEVSDKDFDIEFPTGTKVLDTIKNVEYYVNPTKEQENESRLINEYTAKLKENPQQTQEILSFNKLCRLGGCKDIYVEREKKLPQSISDMNSCLDKETLAWCEENVEYLGKDKSRSDPPDTLIAYNKTLLQKNRRTTALFMNGIVRILTANELEKLGITIPADADQQAAGQNSTIKTLAANAEITKSGREFIKNIGNGVTVELLGVSEHPSKNKQWWSPNGSPISEIYTTSVSVPLRPDNNSVAREFVYRATGPDGLTTSHDFVPKTEYASGNVLNKGGIFSPNLYMLAAVFPKNAQTANIRIAVASDQWTTIATADPEAEKTTLVPPNCDYSLCIFAKGLTTKKGNAAVTVSHNVSDKDIRIVAIGTDGKQYFASYAQGDKISSVMQLNSYFDGVPNLNIKSIRLKKVKQFQFQTRPYQWVEFKNVSLQCNPESTAVQ